MTTICTPPFAPLQALVSGEQPFSSWGRSHHAMTRLTAPNPSDPLAVAREPEALLRSVDRIEIMLQRELVAA